MFAIQHVHYGGLTLYNVISFAIFGISLSELPLEVWHKEIFRNIALYIFVSTAMQNLNSEFNSDFKIHIFERFPSLFSEIIDFY